MTKPPRSAPRNIEPPVPEDRIFTVLVGLISLAFAWVLWPFWGAVFWAVILTILFEPLYRRLLAQLNGRRNLTAALMVLGIVVTVILPLLLIVAAILAELTQLFANLESGEVNLHVIFQQIFLALPDWLGEVLTRMGLSNLTAVQDSMTASVTGWITASAPQVLSIGQNTASIFVSLGVTLYLTFFLLRDGDWLVRNLTAAIPLSRGLQQAVMETFTTVVRATVKGDIVVAMLQGGLGGLGFWFLGVHGAILWMVLMMFLSLFPVFGAALVWGPVAVFYLASGMVWQGVFLILYGVLVIGLIDNVARPYLVGQATKMPDYVVLISTLGGISMLGMQGFIIGPVIAAMFIAAWKTLLYHKRA